MTHQMFFIALKNEWYFRKYHKGTLFQVKKQDLIIQKSFYYYYIPNKVLDFAATLTKESEVKMKKLPYFG